MAREHLTPDGRIGIPDDREYDSVHADLIDAVGSIDAFAERLRPLMVEVGVGAPAPEGAVERSPTLEDVGAAFAFVEGLRAELDNLARLLPGFERLPARLNQLRHDAEADDLPLAAERIGA